MFARRAALDEEQCHRNGRNAAPLFTQDPERLSSSDSCSARMRILKLIEESTRFEFSISVIILTVAGRVRRATRARSPRCRLDRVEAAARRAARRRRGADCRRRRAGRGRSRSSRRCAASVFSRSRRRRMFSVSAAARSSRSLRLATSSVWAASWSSKLGAPGRPLRRPHSGALGKLRPDAVAEVSAEVRLSRRSCKSTCSMLVR